MYVHIQGLAMTTAKFRYRRLKNGFCQAKDGEQETVVNSQIGMSLNKNNHFIQKELTSKATGKTKNQKLNLQ